MNDKANLKLSVKEAADRVGCHPQTMYLMAHSGRVPFDRVGNGRGRLLTSERVLRRLFPNICGKDK